MPLLHTASVPYMEAGNEWVSFVVSGKPSPKKRPRIVTHRDKAGQMVGAHAFTPDDKHYISRVQDAARDAGVTIHEGPVLLWIEVERRHPKGWPKWKAKPSTSGGWLGLLTTTVPDRVNVAANISDALEGVAYHKDSVVHLHKVEERWGEVDQTLIKVCPVWYPERS